MADHGSIDLLYGLLQECMPCIRAEGVDGFGHPGTSVPMCAVSASRLCDSVFWCVWDYDDGYVCEFMCQ